MVFGNLRTDPEVRIGRDLEVFKYFVGVWTVERVA
jgi:hypothetical protein